MLSKAILNRLKEDIDSPNWPLSANDYPYVHTNCLAFALGLTLTDIDEIIYAKIGSISGIPCRLIRPAFLMDCWTLGLNCRIIYNQKEVHPDEHLIKVYGFVPVKLGYGLRYPYGFHIIRRNLDGTWEHKPGYVLPPEKVRWDRLESEFGTESKMFAISRKRKALLPSF